MQNRHLLVFFCLWLFLLTPTWTQSANHESGQARNYPSRELLEFLAEFGDMDEETFRLIEFHAQQDGKTAKQENSDEN